MDQPALSQTRRLILTGFMGSGKSTVGKLLARRLGWSFVDLDSAVEKRCGQPVPELFAVYGEHHFRQEEVAALSPLLQNTEIVLALGGGAAETPAVRELLAQSADSAVIFLNARFDTLHERCLRQAQEPDATARPLLADRDGALARYGFRRQLYEAIATIHIDTEAISPDSATDAILQQLR